jgi:UDP-glucose 4-epimerase
MGSAVAITGLSGNLGRTLAKQLHRSHALIGVDRRPFPGLPKDIELHALDIRKKRCEDLFRTRAIRALVHLGIVHDPRVDERERRSLNVVGTANLLESCARYGVSKVVLLSSAVVYGPSPDNSNFLTEDAPLLGATRFSGMRDLIEVDMFTQSFFYKYPQIETVILRPVHIVGPTIRNAVSNYLRMKRPWVLAGFDPIIQLIHVEDVCRAIEQVLAPGVRGVYNVVGPGEVPLSAVLRELGRVSLPLPATVARPLLRTLFSYKLVPYPPEALDHLQYLCAVDGSRAARDWGYAPRHSLRDTIRSVEPLSI